MEKKLHGRYKEEVGPRGAPVMTEEERFWETKEKQASSRFHTQRKEDKEYDLVLENAVEFVQFDILAGVMA